MRPRGLVAQGLEQATHNRQVAGSNPAQPITRSVADAAGPTVHERRRRETSAALVVLGRDSWDFARCLRMSTLSFRVDQRTGEGQYHGACP